MMAAALTRLIRWGNKPATRFLRPLATSAAASRVARASHRRCRSGSLRAQGVPSRHADVIISAIVKVLEVGSNNADRSFAKKEDLETMKALRDVHLSKLKFEVEETLKLRILTLQCENGKRHWELADKIQKLHRDVEMEIHEVKLDCISRCAKARHDAMIFCIGTLLTAAVAATVLKEVVG